MLKNDQYSVESRFWVSGVQMFTEDVLNIISYILCFTLSLELADSYCVDQSLLPLTQNISLDWTRHLANISSLW